ncbi:MAG TPA: hypothetical protein VJ825_14875 [Gemmatimonadaceae bacterium]|nr:hypothetical protein [Gemmatimonadaceae bacterium]
MNEPTHGIPPEQYQAITAPENSTNAVEAMRSFLRDGDATTFATAVALYVASARYRQEAIENVVAALCTLAESLEGPRRDAEILFRPSKMHELIFTGVLKAFYGEIAVERARGARAQRKADAPQHSERGTWPRRPDE